MSARINANMVNAIKSTVRIISNYEIRDIFNPSELEIQGKNVGTGFFINDNGYILTCYHVVEDSIKLFVSLPDNGRNRYSARIVSLYPEIDLAIIKINDAANKQHLVLGKSDDLQIGNVTIAIGYPLGDETIKSTKGIISGVKDYLLQTDTTINEGNSGGPLLNDRYEVIGINSSKMTGNSVEGVGYSIPIDIFKMVMHRMVHNSPEPNMIFQPNFYCTFQTLERDTARLMSYEYSKNENSANSAIEGYMIINMFKNSPLALAIDPLELYDILTEFDGYVVDKYGDVKSDKYIGKINIVHFIKWYESDKLINIKYFSTRRQKVITTQIKFTNKYLYGVPEVFFPHKIEYINLNGIIICQLSLNHLIDMINKKTVNIRINNLAYMFPYILKGNREIPRIFIGKILPDSDFANNMNVENGECVIIDKANGEPVRTIGQFKQICSNLILSMDSKYYIHLEMLNRENITIPVETISK